MTEESIKLNSEEDEIDLLALIKTAWKGRKTIIKSIIVCMVLGLFIALFSAKEYTASTTMVPASEGKKIGGSLSGLASLAGINLGSMGGGSEISPDLYPQILNSIPFKKELLEAQLTIDGLDKPISFKEYYSNVYKPSVLGYIKKYTIGIPGLLLTAIKGDAKAEVLNIDSSKGSKPLIWITNKEHQLIKKLNLLIALNVNDKGGYVAISASMPEALASAELAVQAQSLLQQYIINFKIQKSKEQLKFIEERYNEKEKEFKLKQEQLARFRDQNLNTNSALAQTALEGLQAEFDLIYGVYFELAKQLETQQLQVKENTPVFTILKPVAVPVEKSKPKRLFILVIWTFLGGVIGIGLVFGRILLSSIKESWNEKEQ